MEEDGRRCSEGTWVDGSSRNSGVADLAGYGSTALLISKFRPTCPIIRINRPAAAAARYSHLSCGVYLFHYPEFKPDFNQVIWQEDVDNLKPLKWGMQKAIELGVLTKRETVIAVQGAQGAQGWRGGLDHTNKFLRARRSGKLVILVLREGD
ncbi:Similar to Pyruvate kinase; acc. no. P31865 [Pyronema omphalodes CBS 100304]|uniref:Similar to Pyruvate kinase acc. no. P31865 n=1 Tax=Pyronema omphalodes (strain CBS 100304) TaxID=1076935 RepID=U4LJA6_PYROM|nr:Similar to Pyruvate kinase; acc. no. P31865 [Pyronema omphalodes CBS 100304]